MNFYYTKYFILTSSILLSIFQVKAGLDEEFYKIYHPFYKKYVFFSGDVDDGDNIIEAHSNSDAFENIFQIHSTGDSRYKISNPHYGKYLFVSSDLKNGDNFVKAHSDSEDQRNIFEIQLQPTTTSITSLYNTACKKYMFVSRDIDNGDNVVEAHSDNKDARNQFEIQKIDWFMPRLSYSMPIGKLYRRPAITKYNDNLILMWRGKSHPPVHNPRISYSVSSDKGQTWSEGEELKEPLDCPIEAATGPALLNYNNTLHLVYRGIGELQYIYHLTSTDGGATFNYSRPSPYHLPGRTSDTPALTVFNDKLLLMWKGANPGAPYEDGDTTIWYSTSSDEGKNWTTQAQLDRNIRTRSGPVLLNYKNTLHMVFRGIDDLDYIYHLTSKNGINWGWGDSRPAPYHLAGRTSDTPALTIFDDKLLLMWKGDNKSNSGGKGSGNPSDGDRTMWFSTSSDEGNTWTPQAIMLDRPILAGPTLFTDPEANVHLAITGDNSPLTPEHNLLYYSSVKKR